MEAGINRWRRGGGWGGSPARGTPMRRQCYVPVGMVGVKYHDIGVPGIRNMGWESWYLVPVRTEVL